MYKILIISELEDYKNTPHFHFSFSKGFEFGKGLAKIAENKVYYYTLGKSEMCDNVNLINEKEIDDEFKKDLNMIIFVRESNVFQVINLPFMASIKKNKGNIKIFIKSDSINWLNDKSYVKSFGNRKNLFHFVYDFFDGICVQTEEMKKFGLNYISEMFNQKYSNFISKKIVISRMGIPNKNPLINEIENPYCIYHTYCVNRGVVNNKALIPLVINKNFNKKKTIIIYTGRIKTERGKVLFIMRDIMKNLGDDYELHIFPGRFCIPDTHQDIYSPKNSNHLELLREKIFKESTNVIIHHPFDDNNKIKYLQHAEIAIDFSPSRPKNEKYIVGNAKLLDYTYHGLKVVCEKNIGNSYLIEQSKNGILLEGIATVDNYVNAIKNIKGINIDKDFAIKTIIKNHNWELIAKEFFEKYK